MVSLAHVLPFPSPPPAHSLFIGPTAINIHTSAENRQKRGDVEILRLNYLQDAAGARNLVFDLAVTYLRLLAQGGSDAGSVCPNHLATLKKQRAPEDVPPPAGCLRQPPGPQLATDGGFRIPS